MSAEIPDGAVIVARAILNSSLWTMRPEDCKLALTCIGMANWKEARWFDGEKSITIRKGEFVTSRDKLAEATHLSVRNIRTGLKNLAKSGFLALKVTSRYTIIFMPKYAHYQDLSKYYDPKSDPTQTQPRPNPDPRVTNDRPAGDHKQEGDKGEEGKEGGAPPDLASPKDGDDLKVTVDSFSAFGTPGRTSKENAIKDLRRQGFSFDEIRKVASENSTLDFYEVVKLFRKNGKHSKSPERPTRKDPDPDCRDCHGTGLFKIEDEPGKEFKCLCTKVRL